MASPTEPPTELHNLEPPPPELGYTALEDTVPDTDNANGQEGGGWTQGAFDGGFDDDPWPEGIDEQPPGGEAEWVADFGLDDAQLAPEEVATIKETMAALDIIPPPWVRKMQHAQRVQQMIGAGQGVAPPQQICAPGGQLLPSHILADAAPRPGLPAGLGELAGLGIGSKPKRVSSRQLAAERRKGRGN